VKRARLEASSAFATLTILVSALASGGVARAAGPDPAAETQRLLTKLDAPDMRSVVQDPVAKAKAAQQRAQNARGAGDLQHATELDTLALTWAQVADDLVRTAAAEKALADLQKTVTDLEQKAVRTQALIEQTIARRGRAEQNLSNESELGGSKKAAGSASAKPGASKPAIETKPASPVAAPKPAAPAKPKPSAPAGSSK
jgi:hypothetical protein